MSELNSDCPNWVDELVQQLAEADVDLDTDFIRKKWNEANPDKPKLTRDVLAKILGCGKQVFTDWKSNKKKTPDWVRQIAILNVLAGGTLEGAIKIRK